VLETHIVTGIAASGIDPGEVAREFRGLVEAGARLRPGGEARRAPASLLTPAYAPKHAIEVFGTTFYLTDPRRGPDDLQFLVAYVVLAADRTLPPRLRTIYPRIFFKDISLVWRCATHWIHSEREYWVGKGDLKSVVEHGLETLYSAEETTNLPLEIQTALDRVSRRSARPARDDRALHLVLRTAPDDRVAAYRDFTEPRRRARQDPRNLVNAGRPVAWFTRENDPASLRFARGYEPDLARGLLESSRSRSRLFGGAVRKYRLLSTNRRIQYLFLAGPRHAWIAWPQPLTTELSSYGVRTIDVEADERLCVPGYEYHYLDDSVDPPRLHTQIPPGYAGAPSAIEPGWADASAWLEALPVIRAFRRSMRIPRPKRRRAAARGPRSGRQPGCVSPEGAGRRAAHPPRAQYCQVKYFQAAFAATSMNLAIRIW
jgi:hypothetical protein